MTKETETKKIPVMAFIKSSLREDGKYHLDYEFDDALNEFVNAHPLAISEPMKSVGLKWIGLRVKILDYKNICIQLKHKHIRSAIMEAGSVRISSVIQFYEQFSVMVKQLDDDSSLDLLTTEDINKIVMTFSELGEKLYMFIDGLITDINKSDLLEK